MHFILIYFEKNNKKINICIEENELLYKKSWVFKFFSQKLEHLIFSYYNFKHKLICVNFILNSINISL
ncbi:hypothetical protein EG344_06245 [Chryseobacterium sp. G0162]|nr:hypothetical protein EG344_06245 [Chryseobacterium sp. G0162]